MDVKVDDGDSVEVVLEEGVLGPDGDVVEEAEALRLDLPGAPAPAAVMPWRSNGADGVAMGLAHDQIDSFDDRPSRIERRSP